MKEKLKYLLMVLSAVTIGSYIGNSLFGLTFGNNNHVCECERCKVTRQLESIELIDSIIHDRIVFNVIEQ